MKQVYFTAIILSIIITPLFSSPSEAFESPHPASLYEKGIQLVNQYHGDNAALVDAQRIFLTIIEKHPDSPFGYLGMSRIYTIKAYQYGDHFNMRVIREEALPFAIKALESGPSLRIVHENYGVFEEIFNKFYKEQKHVKDYLAMFPDSPETYLAIGDFVRDQGDFKNALRHYKHALGLDPAKVLRLKILQRIALIYLERFDSPQKAAMYLEKAQKIWDSSPIINEYLGIAYLKMGQYPEAIQNLNKSLSVLNAPIPQSYLLEAKALLLKEQGHLAEAIQLLEQALSFRRESSSLHYALGNLYYLSHQFENAYTQFQRVIDLKPQEAKAYYYAGRSIQSLGNTDLAHDYYRKYIQLNDDKETAPLTQDHAPDVSFSE